MCTNPEKDVLSNTKLHPYEVEMTVKRRDLIQNTKRNLKMDFDECASNPKLPIAAPELQRGGNEN